MLKTVEKTPIPRGDAQFESNRQEILKEFADKVPKNLILPEAVIDDAPPNVTDIPRSCGLLTAEELDITEKYDLVGLAEAIASRQLTSLAVTTAFCKRAIIAHQLTFCLTGWFMDEAVARAKELDDYIARTGETVGPLHGIPISIKEMVPIAGHLTSLSLIVTRHIAPKDCLLVSILRDLGAVFYVTTNQPEGVSSAECTSFLGRTLNPYNTDLTSGGSSGGEAALLAMRGSVFGIGTDLAGSIRTPAAFCGVYGLKGSSGLLPLAGTMDVAIPVGLVVDPIIGPLARSLRDLNYVMKHFQGEKPYLRDPNIIPFAWTGIGTLRGKDRKSIKIGIMNSDEIMQPRPPVKRALDWAHSQLQSAGFSVLSYKFYEPVEADRLFRSLCTVDGAIMHRQALQAGNEPEFPGLEAFWSHMISSDPNSKEGQVEGGMAIAEKMLLRENFRTNFLADWVAQGDPDIILCPASIGPAFPHDTWKGHINYVSPWNLMDYPAISIPTPSIAEARESYNKDEYESVEPWTDTDRYMKELWTHKSHVGAPICLQAVAKRHHENEMFAVLDIIQESLQLP